MLDATKADLVEPHVRRGCYITGGLAVGHLQCTGISFRLWLMLTNIQDQYSAVIMGPTAERSGIETQGTTHSKTRGEFGSPAEQTQGTHRLEISEKKYKLTSRSRIEASRIMAA